MALGTGVGRKGVVGQDWSGRARRVRLVIHVRPQTSEGHNFFIRTLIRVFLDSMESPLNQDYSHSLVDVIGYWSRPKRSGQARLVG